MKLILERHAYAPELNRAHIVRRGRIVRSLPVPGAQSIKEARKALFPRADPRRFVEAESYRAAPWAGLNRAVRAAYRLEPGVMNRLWRDSRTLRDAGGRLIDGQDLPPSKVRVTTRLFAVTVS